jgi:hypothetical protein
LKALSGKFNSTARTLKQDLATEIEKSAAANDTVEHMDTVRKTGDTIKELMQVRIRVEQALF